MAILFTLRVFARNLLRGNRRRNANIMYVIIKYDKINVILALYNVDDNYMFEEWLSPESFPYVIRKVFIKNRITTLILYHI